MALYNGDEQIHELYNGDTYIEELYNGDTKIFDAGWDTTITSIPATLSNARAKPTSWEIKGKSQQSRLPDGYTELEYIQSSGTQYIRTNQAIASTTRIDLDAEATISDATNVLIGSNNNSSNPSASIVATSTSTITVYWGNTNTRVETTTTNRHLYSFNQNIFSIDGATKYTFSSTWSGVPSLGINTVDQGSSILGTYIGSGKFYSVKIWGDGTTLSRNFIPAKRISDSEIGMYDLVNDIFYTNAGSGTFTAGPSLPSPTSPVKVKGVGNSGLPSGYTEYAYVDMTTAGGYIDTGIKAQHEAFKVEIDASLSAPHGTLGAQVGPGNTSTHLVYNNNFYIGNSEGACSGIFSQTIRGTVILESTADKHYSITKYDGTVGTGTYTGTIISGKNYYLYGMNAASLNASGTGKIYSVKFYDDGVLVGHFVPAKNSNNEIGLYNIVDNTFHEKQGRGTIVVGPEHTSYVVVPVKMSDGTTETTYTISLPAQLQKIGTYADSIESDGTLTRGVGVKVLDGTENWTYTNNAIYAKLVYANIPLYGLCSHFNYSTASVIAEMNNGEFIFNKSGGAADGNLSLKSNSFTDLTTATTWLAAQYAAGTPVTVYYPLATATETSIQVPTISTAKGTNYVDVETEVEPSGVSITYRKRTSA